MRRSMAKIWANKKIKELYEAIYSLFSDNYENNINVSTVV